MPRMGQCHAGNPIRMAELTTWRDRLAGGWRRQQEEYAHGEDRPLGGYAATMSVYGGMIAAVAAAVRLTGTSLAYAYAEQRAS